MRKTCVALMLGAFVWTGAARSGDDKEARAIVDKAIKAVGGIDKLKKHQAVTWRGKGKFYGMGDGLDYTGNYAVQWPDQFKMEIEGVFTMVVTKDKGWFKFGGETKEMSKEEHALQVKNHKAGWVTTLLPLTDKAFKLQTIGETPVEKRPALGVRVTRDGFPDVTLYFDKKNGRLVKSEFRTISQEQKKEVNTESYYRDYKEVDGAWIPMHHIVKQDGKLYVDEQVVELKAVEKLDAGVFAMP